jgi:hypothetical protein
VVTFFHVTTAEAAETILREGFQDGSGTYMTSIVLTGVWLSDSPLDCNDLLGLTMSVSFGRVKAMSGLATYETAVDRLCRELGDTLPEFFLQGSRAAGGG